jgi:hypothetical protein
MNPRPVIYIYILYCIPTLTYTAFPCIASPYIALPCLALPYIALPCIGLHCLAAHVCGVLECGAGDLRVCLSASGLGFRGRRTGGVSGWICGSMCMCMCMYVGR